MALSRARQSTLRVRGVVLGSAGFIAFIAASMRAYPGGTWAARGAVGHSFWGNFWCDLLNPVALNGAINTAGAITARLAFASLALALLCFWPLARALSGSCALARVAARLGGIGATGLLLVTGFPSLTSEAAHAGIVSGAGLAGVSAAALMLPALSRRTDLLTRATGLLLLTFAAVNLVQYLREAYFSATGALWLPGVQKVTTFLLIAWMLRVASFARNPALDRSYLKRPPSTM